MRKSVVGVSNQVRHKPGCEAQKAARGLKFRIQEVKGSYPCSKNKGADQLFGFRCQQLICVFIFAYAKSRFSHTMAQNAVS